jgi:hypothetical protein
MAKRSASKAVANPAAPRLRTPSPRREAIRVALESLRDSSGRLTPEAVVRAAKNPRHVLHREFGWDDRQQAHLHRIDRARELIVRYVSTTVIYKSERVTVPFYVRDPSAAPATQGYMALAGAEMTRENALAILLAEFDRCESSISRARRIVHVLDAKFPGLSQQLESLLEKLIEIRRALAA